MLTSDFAKRIMRNGKFDIEIKITLESFNTLFS